MSSSKDSGVILNIEWSDRESSSVVALTDDSSLLCNKIKLLIITVKLLLLIFTLYSLSCTHKVLRNYMIVSYHMFT